MRLIENELCRLARSKFIWTALVLCFAVSTLFTLTYHADPYIPNSAYRALDQDLAPMSDTEKLSWLKEKSAEYAIYEKLTFPDMGGEEMDFSELTPNAAEYVERFQKDGAPLQYTANLFLEKDLYDQTFRHLSFVTDYDGYLKQIEQNAEQMQSISIFSDENSFTYRNSEKTVEAYRPLYGTQTRYGPSYGIVSATGNTATNFALAAFVLVATLYLLVSQKSSGMLLIVRTSRYGRWKFIAAQLCAIVLVCIGATVLFVGGNLIAGAAQFGLGDLSRPIQSVVGFTGCVLRVNAWQYLVLFMALKAAALVAVAMLTAFLCMAAKSDAFILLTAGAIAVGEGLLYVVISPLSVMSLLKYANLAAVLDTNGILRQYTNINFFSFPIDLRLVSLLMIAVCMVLFAAAAIYWYVRRGALQWSGGKFAELLIRLNPLRRCAPMSLLYHETYKLLIANKVLVLLAALAVIQVWHYDTYRRPYDPEDAVFKSYAEQVAGMELDEVQDFIETEQLRFDALMQKQADIGVQYANGELTQIQYQIALSSLQQELAPMNGFQKLKDRADYLVQHCPNGGIVYDTGYPLLYQVSTSNIDQPLMLILFLALCVCPSMVYDREKTTSLIIHATRYGPGRSRRYRWALMSVVAIGITVATYLPLLVNVSKTYGLGGLGYAIQSLPAFASFPLPVSIGGFLVLLYVLRLVLAELGVLVLMAVAKRCKSVVTALLAGGAALALPVALYLAIAM